MATEGGKRRRRRKGRRPIGEETRALVVRLYDEDKMTCKQIAAACQISERSVYRVVRAADEKEGSGET